MGKDPCIERPHWMRTIQLPKSGPRSEYSTTPLCPGSQTGQVLAPVLALALAQSPAFAYLLSEETPQASPTQVQNVKEIMDLQCCVN